LSELRFKLSLEPQFELQTCFNDLKISWEMKFAGSPLVNVIFFVRLESSQDRDDGEDDNDGDEEDGMTEVNIRLSLLANFHS